MLRVGSVSIGQQAQTRPFPVDPDDTSGAALGHEEGLKRRAAEAHVRDARILEGELAQLRTAFGWEHLDPSGPVTAAENEALGVEGEAVGDASRSQVAELAHGAQASRRLDGKGVELARTGLAHHEGLVVGRESDPVGKAQAGMEPPHGSLRRRKANVAWRGLLGGRAGGCPDRVGEIDVASRVEDEVVGSVERLSFRLREPPLDLAVRRDPLDPARLGAVEAAVVADVEEAIGPELGSVRAAARVGRESLE